MQAYALAGLLFLAALAPTTDAAFWHYKAVVTSVYDGDTLTADIYLGMGIWKRSEKVRLVGINAPEVRGIGKEAGLLSRDQLVSLLGNREIVIETLKDTEDKYGRLLGTIWIKGTGGWCPVSVWCNVNDELVRTGHAIEATY